LAVTIEERFSEFLASVVPDPSDPFPCASFVARWLEEAQLSDLRVRLSSRGMALAWRRDRVLWYACKVFERERFREIDEPQLGDPVCVLATSGETLAVSTGTGVVTAGLEGRIVISRRWPLLAAWRRS
jgi:hypothetical protein